MSKTTKKATVKAEQNVEIYQEIFQIVKNNGVYGIGVCNNWITRNTFATAKEAKEYIDSKPWELIVNVSCLMYDMSKKQNNK